jgi:hypothetical protein
MGFGIQYEDEAVFYEGILDEPFAELFFSTLEQGVVLPYGPYQKFTRLVTIISGGAFLCDQTVGAFCVMQKSCASVPALWDYSFNLHITESGWLKVPIATFASEYNGECRIHV